MTKKEKIISFAWQHLLLFIALYIMTLGIAACVKSMLGASVISVLPYVFHDAGTGGLTPSLTIGQYTFIMNALLVVGQVGVLRRQFDPVQLFQLLVGFVFGMLIDLNLYLLSWLQPGKMRQRDHAWRRLSRRHQQGDGHRISESQDCGRRFTGASRHRLLLHLLRKMAMAYHRSRYAVCHVLCRMGRTYCQPPSEMVRPSA